MDTEALVMAVLRPHLALTVTDVARAVPFYEALLGTAPEKLRPGYAKFSVEEPALNFTLNQGERSELGAFNHAGIQVASTDDVLAAKERLVSAGLAAFATHEDSEEFGERGRAAAGGTEDCGCAGTGCGCATAETASVCSS
jgi:predicted enzyme related to lactoylglutathione lyase